MKQALSQNGAIINASPEAPKQAICPNCQGAVMLRHRSLMNNGEPSYYWRHLNNRNRTCKARTNLIQYHIPNRSLYNSDSNPI